MARPDPRWQRTHSAPLTRKPFGARVGGDRMTFRRGVPTAVLMLALLTASTTEAQEAQRVSRIGFAAPMSRASGLYLLESFRAGLRELGYVDGIVRIVARWAEGTLDSV